MVEVRLLGPVSVGQGDVSLGGAKQRGLLAMLAANVPPHRTDEQLIHGLWEGDPPVSARNAVQVYVTGLRRALQPCGLQIVRAGDGYRLAGLELDVDAVRFETGVAQGRAALRAGDAARAAEVLGRVLDMWTGTPFDGVHGLPVIEQWRAALEGVRQSALADLATALNRTGRHDDALRTAQRLVDEHPYDERGWVALATAQYWLGRQADALATCERVRSLLADELGVDPGPELAELPVLILRQEMGDAPEQQSPSPEDQPEQSALPPPPPPPELVLGREALLDELTARVMGAGARMVTLTGMGGIGKTTVVLRLVHRLLAEGVPVVFTELESETEARGALERVCRALGLEAGDDPGAALAQGPADVVVLDNAEQVRDLGRWLDEAVERHPRPRFVVTSRAPLGSRREHLVAVPPLPVTDEHGGRPPAVALFWAAADRVRSRVEEDREQEAAEALCSLLGGIPLAIELVARRVRTQRATQLLERVRAGRVSLLDAAHGEGLPPRQASLLAVLAAASVDLPVTAHQVLGLVTAVDGWVRSETVEQAADRNDILTDLETLLDRGLIEVDGDGRLRAPVPVRDFVRRDEGAAEARQRVGRAVLALAEEQGPLLYGAASEQALTALLGDVDAALTVLGWGVQDGGDPDATRVGARVVVALRRFWLLGSRIPEARRVLHTLRRSPVLPPVERARLGVLEGNLAQWVGDPSAPELLEAALREASLLGAAPDRLLVSGWCSLAAAVAVTDEAERARSILRVARESAQASRDDDLLALVRDLEGYVAGVAGDHETAVRVTLESLPSARAGADPRVVVSLLSTLAENLIELGRDADAQAASEEAFTMGVRLMASAETVVTLVIRAEVQVLTGEVAAGRGSCLEALRLALDIFPSPKLLSDGMVVLAVAESAHGQHETAARLIGAVMRLRTDIGLTREGYVESRIGRAAEHIQEHLAADRWEVLTALGGADPTATLQDRLASAG